MLRDYTLREKGDAKLCAKFCGPFWILDKLGDVNYRIVDKEGGTPKVVHHNRIKPYVARQPVVIPERVKNNSKELACTSKSAEVRN